MSATHTHPPAAPSRSDPLCRTDTALYSQYFPLFNPFTLATPFYILDRFSTLAVCDGLSVTTVTPPAGQSTVGTKTDTAATGRCGWQTPCTPFVPPLTRVPIHSLT